MTPEQSPFSTARGHVYSDDYFAELRAERELAELVAARERAEQMARHDQADTGLAEARARSDGHPVIDSVVSVVETATPVEGTSTEQPVGRLQSIAAARAAVSGPSKWNNPNDPSARQPRQPRPLPKSLTDVRSR